MKFHSFIILISFITVFGVKKIKSTGTGIFSIPNDSSITDITLSMKGITQLIGYLCSQTPNISSIDFSYNTISNVDANTFRGPTKKLRFINLSHNNIEAIDKTLFMDTVNLAELNLGYNFIEHFEVDLLKLHDLKLLRLDNNKIKRLDCTIFQLTTNTIFIDVDHNHIQEVDFNCDVHIDSMQLSINNNQLTTLTFPKVNFVNGVTKMYAAHNLIEKIMFEGNLLELTHLDLNANNLKDFAAWEDTMFPKLTRLNINYNQFNCTYLDYFLKKLPKTIRLEQTVLESLERSKTIHGINCNEDMTSDAYVARYAAYGNTTLRSDDVIFVSDVSNWWMWCLLALLSFAVVILCGFKIFKIKKYRRERAERTSIKLEDV